MGPRLIVLVHTVRAVMAAFDDAWALEMPAGVEPLHVLDEPLLEQIRTEGSVGSVAEVRLEEHIAFASAIGAAGVLVTCSTVSLGVAAVRSRSRVPVVAVDDRLLEVAAAHGPRLTVVATAPSALEATLKRLAALPTAGDRPVVRGVLVQGAFDDLRAGNIAAHDAAVEAAVRDAARAADAVVLAQASMSRVQPALDAQPAAAPVLSSPRLALAELRDRLAMEGPSR